MSFDDLPALPPLFSPLGAAYAERIIAASRLAQKEIPVVIDQAYATDDYWQKLDVYKPKGAAKTGLPVLVFLHGGAWINGAKEWCGFQAPAMVDLPMIFVTPSYRHAPQAKFPAHLDDVVASIGWVYRNIAKHGGDPNKIYISGHSAGGHLAALATLRRDVIAAQGLPADIIKGCFPVSGPYDLSSDDPLRQQKVQLFLKDLADVNAASPVRNVAGNKVPFIISYGTNDLPELPPAAKAMAEALRAAGSPVELLELKDRNHFQTHEDCGLRDGVWVQKIRSVLAKA